MANLPLLRRILKVFHPEAIPRGAAAVYNLLSGTSIFQRHYERVAQDIVQCCPDGSILDIGTGPGWLLLKLHQAAPGSRIAAIDVSAAMVEQACRNVAAAGLADVIEVRQGSAGAIPFPDGSFDVVVSTGSIHHWKEPVAGLNECYRVLRPGGRALIYDVASDTPRAVLQESRREFGRLRILLFWLHAFEEPFYSRASMEGLATASLFGQGQTRFVGVLCCLEMEKGTA